MFAFGIKPEDLYAKDKNLRREDVESLQEWLKKQPHLPEMTEIQVMMFLHSCYYGIEQAKATIDYYFTKVTHFSHIFKCVNEEEIRNASEFFQVDTQKTPENFVLLVVKLFDCKSENFNLLPTLRVIVTICKLYLHQNPCLDGAVAVFDLKGFGLGHFIKLNPIILKHLADFVQVGAPIRIKGIHAVNVVPLLEKVLVMVKPFLKPELFDMIQLHSSFGALHEQVPKKCLPKELGGDQATYQVLHDKSVDKCLQNYDFCKWHDSQVVDESKRLEKMKSSDFGEDGTFRRLDID